MKKIFLALVLITLPLAATALESDYAKPFCANAGGQYQVALKDASGQVVAYADCLTDSTAWEIDFAANWYEAVGQAHYYAALTGKRPGIALIVTDPSQQKYLDRLRATALYWGWHCLDIRVLY